MVTVGMAATGRTASRKKPAITRNNFMTGLIGFNGFWSILTYQSSGIMADNPEYPPELPDRRSTSAHVFKYIFVH
jgi:hypothetical protein